MIDNKSKPIPLELQRTPKLMVGIRKLEKNIIRDDCGNPTSCFWNTMSCEEIDIRKSIIAKRSK